MRLSDAILMGSTAVKPMAYGVLLDLPSGPQGCAFGMAMYAIGIKDESEMDGFGGDKLMPREWSWCRKTCTHDLCTCQPSTDPRLRDGTYHGYIAHLFNEHVAKGNMSIEQLADYVRSIEPTEEAEKLPEPTADDGYYDDEPLWSDTQTAIERVNSIKGR